MLPCGLPPLTEDERNALAGAPKHYDKGFDTDIDWWLKNEAAVTNAGWSGLTAQLGVATQSVKVTGVKPATATGTAQEVPRPAWSASTGAAAC
ncbi:hypothetical protein [Streptomyces sp. HUAS ZL42]|uniref:hypothetical protein n=1 Tax=Streptomyces sp. HUAS ZL42 TaxID=3231715 RepID=UPI00345E5626